MVNPLRFQPWTFLLLSDEETCPSPSWRIFSTCWTFSSPNSYPPHPQATGSFQISNFSFRKQPTVNVGNQTTFDIVNIIVWASLSSPLVRSPLYSSYWQKTPPQSDELFSTNIKKKKMQLLEKYFILLSHYGYNWTIALCAVSVKWLHLPHTSILM